MSSSPSEFEGDDFDWRRYHLEYAAQIEEIDNSHTLRLEESQWGLRGRSIVLNRGMPLHPNHKMLYEMIVALNPGSVLEAGCGGGDHLHNLSMLLPDASIRGVDRSPGQLEVLRRRNPSMREKASVVDLTLPHPKDVGTADVVFTQAVLMHIQTGNGHRVAIWNLFDLATQQVVLMENLERHDLLADIADLWRRDILPWGSMNLYEATSSGPRLVVASHGALPSSVLEEQRLSAVRS